MYVCVCNAIKECELRQAAVLAMGDVDAVYDSIGAKPDCRMCMEEAEEIIEEERIAALHPAAA